MRPMLSFLSGADAGSRYTSHAAAVTVAGATCPLAGCTDDSDADICHCSTAGNVVPVAPMLMSAGMLLSVYPHTVTTPSAHVWPGHSTTVHHHHFYLPNNTAGLR